MSIMDLLKNLGGNKEDRYVPPESGEVGGDPHRAMVDQIRRAAGQACRFENVVHPPTVLAALGALAGFGCQAAVREGLIKSGQLTEAKAFEVVQTLEGDDYYYGQEINKLLMLNPNSVYAVICGSLMKAGSREYPDVEGSFKKVLESFGGPSFGRPDVPPEYQPRISPLDCLRRLWPELQPTVAPYWQGERPKMNPLAIGSLFAAAAHLAIVDYQENIPPAISGRLVFETALSMSGINPASLPAAPPETPSPASPSQAPPPVPPSQAQRPTQPAPQAPKPAATRPQFPDDQPGAGGPNQRSGIGDGRAAQAPQGELINWIMNTVIQKCVFDGAPHAPTALGALGAMAGFGCQMAIRDDLIKTGQMPESEVLMVSEAPDGSRYYFGPLLNQPLLMLPTSVYSIICEGIQAAGGTEFPDPEATLKRMLDSLGTPAFGLPALPPAYQLRARPLDCLKHFWPQFYPRISQYYGDPAQGGLSPIALGWFFATAAQGIIVSAKEVIPPALAGQLTFETAMSMARLDPALVGRN